MPPSSAADFLASDTLLVLDLLQQAWCGPWRSDAFRLREFAPFYQGDEPRVAILGHEGDCCELFPPAGGTGRDAGARAILSEVRVSLLGSIQQKQPGTVVAEIETLGTRHRLAYEADGVGEGAEVLRREPDNAANRGFGAAAVDFTNAGDSLLEPLREDYSFDLPAAGADMHSVTGWQLGQAQRSHETATVPSRFRSCTLGVGSNQGRLAVRQIALVAPGLPTGRGSAL
jgi:hypothetical protein